MIEIVLIPMFASLTLLYASWILLYLRPGRKFVKRWRTLPSISVIIPALNEALKTVP